MTQKKQEIPELNIFGKIDKTKINNISPPYKIRNDCKLGMWKTGDENLIGNKLSIAILKTVPFYGNLGQTRQAQWQQIWFVAAPKEEQIPQNIICVTYIKTQSLSNLGQKIIELMGTTNPGLGIFETSFQPKQGEYGNYYVVNWQWRERTPEEIPQLQLMADLLNSSPILTDPTLPETMFQLSEERDPIEIAQADKKLNKLEQSKSK